MIKKALITLLLIVLCGCTSNSDSQETISIVETNPPSTETPLITETTQPSSTSDTPISPIPTGEIGIEQSTEDTPDLSLLASFEDLFTKVKQQASSEGKQPYNISISFSRREDSSTWFANMEFIEESTLYKTHWSVENGALKHWQTLPVTTSVVEDYSDRKEFNASISLEDAVTVVLNDCGLSLDDMGQLIITESGAYTGYDFSIDSSFYEIHYTYPGPDGIGYSYYVDAQTGEIIHYIDSLPKD